MIAGNEYLAAYARRFNHGGDDDSDCVDTERFVPAADAGSTTRLRTAARPGRRLDRQPDDRRPTSASLAGVLQRVRERHPFALRVSGTGEPFDDARRRRSTTRRGRSAGEVELFNTCDVGVYPLADDEWSKGKCGFKAIEFMACGVPVVAAAVGVNREIIQDGENGFLASTDDEWVDKLARLLSDRRAQTALCGGGPPDHRGAIFAAT